MPNDEATDLAGNIIMSGIESHQKCWEWCWEINNTIIFEYKEWKKRKTDETIDSDEQYIVYNDGPIDSDEQYNNGALVDLH